RAERAIQTVKVYDEQKPVGRALEKVEQSADSSPSADTLASESEFAESPASDSIAVIEQPKDSLLKRAARIAKVKSEMGMIRALYGVVEEDMGRAVALYGVRPPREIIMPDGPREIHQPKPVPRCFVKELTETDVVAGKDNDIDVEYFLKVFHQRSPGIRHICNKNLYKNVKYRAKRTKEFEGKTVFEMKISPSGNVENVEIKSTNDQFSEEIRKSIARWAFPKTKKGGTFTFPVNLYEVIPSAASSASEQPQSQTNDH
ncbi:MAG: AgmX/PglI C-terminal domain-containing protein, partial [Fibrobacter sp.]|nr:AgmX/PglI C-terminal domain-containing protein [Fibrobacter sp.]